MIRRWLHLLSAAALAALLAGCGSDEPESERPRSTPSSPTSEGTPSTRGDGSFPPATPPSTPPEDEGSLEDVVVDLAEVATLEAPTALTARPGTDQSYVAERGGRVVTLDGDTVIDISGDVSTGGERGLLGLAFSAGGDRLYLSYTNPDGDTRVAEYRMDGNRADPGSRRELLAVEQPFPNHNGGDLHLGPDGLLYLGLGDGGAANDPDDRAQDPNDLLGKLLRIDPRRPAGGRPYSIPADNPFADGGGAPEVYLWGVRNPWRFSFDRETDDLWIGDVGQDAVEEVDFLPRDRGAGANLGWSGYEGTRVFIEDRVPETSVPPIYEYTHETTGGCSITGGVVYRGETIDGLAGSYLYADFCVGQLRAFHQEGGRVVTDRDLGVDVPQLVSINEDAAGEVYLLSLSGPVYRLEQG